MSTQYAQKRPCSWMQWPGFLNTKTIRFWKPSNSFISCSFGFCPFFDLRLNKRLSRQSRGWRFEMPSCPLWRHRNVHMLQIVGMTPSLIHRQRDLTLEAFRSLQKFNPPCLHELFKIYRTEYLTRNPWRLTRPKRRTTNSGIRPVSYIRANIWNQLPFIGHMYASQF